MAALVAIALLLLPIVSLIRIRLLEREIAALRTRLEHVEREGAGTAAGAELSRSAARALAPASPAAIPVLPSSTRFETPPGPAPETVDGEPELIERQIGERLLLYSGMIVVVLGVAFFLRYAFERQWLSPLVRVLAGGGAGIALIAGGGTLANRGYRQYGLFLCGGGFAVLFLSAYAAFALYGLIARPPAFILLALVAAGAAFLADRTASLPLAFMAVCGGFATPFLVGGADDPQLTLFTYDALLIAATMYLAHRKQWPWLNVASLGATIVTVAAWAASYYTPDKYLRTELFLTLYCAMFVVILHGTVRSSRPGAREASWLLWCAPIAYHLASLIILDPHPAAFPVYVILASLAIVVASSHWQSSVVRLAGWGAVTLPFLLWIDARQDGARVAGCVAAAVGVWLMFLMGQMRLVRAGARLDAADLVLLHANGLAAFVAVYETLSTRVSPWALAGIAGVFALANGAVWAVLRRSGAPEALHALAVAASLAAMAAAVALDGPWVVTMWAAEGAGVAAIGVRAGRPWFRRAGLGLLALAVARWIQPDVQETGASFVVLFNARALSGLFIVSLLYVVARVTDVPESGFDRRADRALRLDRAIALVAASALTVVLISAEISSYWAVPIDRGLDAQLARSLMLSAAWAAYAAGLIAVGMRRHYPPIRYLAIGLLGLTLVKVFVVDLQQLGGLYRIVGFLVVGAILLLVSFLYQRSRGYRASGSPAE